MAAGGFAEGGPTRVNAFSVLASASAYGPDRIFDDGWVIEGGYEQASAVLRYSRDVKVDSWAEEHASTYWEMCHKTKKKPDGFTLNKARLVVPGFEQIYRIITIACFRLRCQVYVIQSTARYRGVLRSRLRAVYFYHCSPECLLKEVLYVE